MTFGERIRLLRKERKMTLEDVASGIGVSRATILRYETGEIANIPSDKIEAMAKIFNVSPAYLMGWSNSQTGDYINSIQYFHISDPVKKMIPVLNELTPEQLEQATRVINAMFAIKKE